MAFVAPPQTVAPLPVVKPAPFPDTVTIAQGNVDTSLAQNSPGDFLNPTNLFNGSYLNVWTVNPGSTIASALDISGMNFQPPYTLPDGTATTQYTNLHFHGFNVSPLGNSDDIYRQVAQGAASAPYAVRIPQNHPLGSFWLHPHPHGISEPQVLGGLSALLIVEGLLPNYFPAVVPAVEDEHYFLLKDYLPSDSGNGCLAKTINGVATGMVNDGSTASVPLGMVDVTANATYYWHFANIGADQFFDIKLIDKESTPQTMYVVAIDGNVTAKTGATNATPVATAIPLSHLFLAPGARMDVLVSLPPGDYNLWSDAYDTGSDDSQGMAGDANCAVQLAWVRSTTPPSGEPVRRVDLAALPPGNRVDRPTLQQLQQAADSATPPCKPQSITFDEWVDGSNNTIFAINGQAYQPGQQVLTIPPAPCTEYWTIQNTTPEAHVFHIHQLDYYVVGGDRTMLGSEYDPSYLLFQDVVTLPPRGTVNLYVPFTNRIAQGGFVLHCHILGHEDAGMMADVCFGDCPNLPTSHSMKH